MKDLDLHFQKKYGGSGGRSPSKIFDNICKKDKPPGYDPKRHKFTNHWKDNFCRRFHISVQQKTNNKAKSVYERIHKIKNYHYYVIYLLGKGKYTAVVNHFSEK